MVGNSGRRDWLRAVFFGLVMAGVFFGVFRVVGRQPIPAIVGGVVGGVLFAIMSFRSTGARREQAARAHEALGFELSPAVRRDALKGLPASDTDGRRRQLAVVLYLLDRVRAGLKRNSVIFVLFTGLSAVQALTTSAWFWLVTAFFGSMALLTPWEIARLRRRRVELASAP